MIRDGDGAQITGVWHSGIVHRDSIERLLYGAKVMTWQT